MERQEQWNRAGVTVVIPVYNQEKKLKRCIAGLKASREDFRFLEILLINDGSTDHSGALCESYAEKYSNVRYFFQENKGVSAARNTGIKNARGKYIFFLDADDSLKPGTIARVAEFFDAVYEETDLVTYPIETICGGKRQPPHFRYRYLNANGVYSLWEYPYIGQTTMNIAVKNKFRDNILFDEAQTFSEDQKYCCQVLKDKMRMGYCAKGRYLYYRSKSSSSGKLSGACFIFEQCTAFFEQLFEEYEDVPAAFQGLLVNDIYWKLASNILFPYHYKGADFREAVKRLEDLLKRCSNSVILYHPQIDFFEKFYLLSLKGRDTLQCRIDKESYSLWDKDRLVVSEDSMEIVLTKVTISHHTVELRGFLKTVFFQFYDREPVLCAVENDGSITRKLPLFSSAHNYYQSHEKTQHFWAFCYRFAAEQMESFCFEVELGGCLFPVHFYFMPLVPFSHALKRFCYRKGSVELLIDQDNTFHCMIRKPVQRPRIWIYCDCRGVACDNGLIQYMHDKEKKDGIMRYYILTDERQKAKAGEGAACVLFGSKRHQKLFLQAEKLICAFIEPNNLIPFPEKDYDIYAGKFQFEVIYLQHGVLHIDMPWKYSPEKILADKIVVSAKAEAELFLKNGFCPQNLWKLKMPRFDMPKKPVEKKRKILYAPSWRSYLVGNNVDGRWERLEEKFLHSTFYRKIQVLIGLQPLEELLEQQDYILEIKLHPIFEQYRNCFCSKNSRITFVDTAEPSDGYSLFLTDFSSYLYDFAYMDIPVMIFLPDAIEFQSGMNGYRNLNVPGEYRENIAVWPEELVEKLRLFLETGEYMKFPVAFFPGENAAERIYEACLSEPY